MRQLIEKLLEKPESYRRKVAFITTGIIGIIIFSIWIVITQYNIKQAFNSRKTPKTTAQQFKESLPSLKDNQTITTELMKQQKKLK